MKIIFSLLSFALGSGCTSRITSITPESNPGNVIIEKSTEKSTDEITESVLDLNFNGQGFLVGSSYGANASTGPIELDSLGKLVVAGSYRNAYYYNLFVKRFLPNGLIDPTFGIEGTFIYSVNTNLQNGGGRPYGLKIDKSGNIFVFGVSDVTDGQSFSQRATIWKITPAGILDNLFDGTGYKTFETNHQFSGIEIDTSGKILLASHSNIGTTYGGVNIWRLNSDGSIDTNFNGNGNATYYVPGSNSFVPAQVKLDSFGRILILGSSFPSGCSSWTPTIARIKSNGDLDTDFGQNGFFIFDCPSDVRTVHVTGPAIALDTSGNIFITGTRNYLNEVKPIEMVVIKLDSNGRIDTTFANNGTFSYNNGTNSNLGRGENNGNSIAIDSTGKIIVAGWDYNPDISEAGRGAIFKLNSNGTLDSTFANNGIFIIENSDWNGGITLDDNNKIYLAGGAKLEGSSVRIGFGIWVLK